ncbi:hypothetical protein SDC9_109682 [bioreactor metagenome]|uniref:Uncharacterized protein n=1 Tax=bioreactor metagenome TaxID=1076179 RepID=A0A645BLV1_9ZZZZ
MKRLRRACRPADAACGGRRGADADQQLRACHLFNGASRLVVETDSIGGFSQRDFTQQAQILFHKEISSCALRLFLPVNLSFFKSAEQFVRFHVHKLDLVGAFKDCIRHSLLNLNLCNVFDDVVETLNVLNIDRGKHIDSGVKQFLNILIPLAVSDAFGIGMRKLIDQNKLRFAGERRVEIKFVQRHAAIGD